MVAAVLVPGPRAPAAGEHDLINGPQGKSAASLAGRQWQAGRWLWLWAHSLLCGNVVRNALRIVKALLSTWLSRGVALLHAQSWDEAPSQCLP